MKALKTEKIDKQIEKITVSLLEKLQVEAEVKVAKVDEDNYKANISTPDTGLLIGRLGETINSLQLLLGVILYKKLGSWIRVIVDVGDYRKTREESIKQMVTRIVAEVENDSQPVTLPYLTPFERRIVHIMLADHEKVTSESVGEGRDRRLTIKPKLPELR